MYAGANKDDAKEKRKTFYWNDETIFFALREIIRAGTPSEEFGIEEINSSSELHAGPSIPRWS